MYTIGHLYHPTYHIPHTTYHIPHTTYHIPHTKVYSIGRTWSWPVMYFNYFASKIRIKKLIKQVWGALRANSKLGLCYTPYHTTYHIPHTPYIPHTTYHIPRCIA